MLLGCLIIITFYCIGAWTQQQFDLPIPGSVIGMLTMFTFLLWRKKAPICLTKGSHALISNLTLLLIPSCVGVITCFSILQQEGLLITASLLLSIVLSIVITGWILTIFGHRIDHTGDRRNAR